MLPSWLKYIFAASSGILLFFSFPPYKTANFGFIALIPLLIALKSEKRLVHCGLLGFICGLFFFLGLLSWISGIEFYQTPRWMFGVGWIFIALLFSIYFFIFGIGFGFLEKRVGQCHVLIAPFLWTTLEYIRSMYPMGGFTWGILGYSQYQNLPIIQIADITGVFGISFLLLLINSAITSFFLDARKFREKSAKKDATSIRIFPVYTNLSLSFSLLIIVLVFGYGWNTFNKQRFVPDVKIAIIQGNIKMEDKEGWQLSKQRILQRLIALSQKAGKYQPNLIIWSETAVVDFSQEVRDRLSQLACETKSYLLIGAPYIDQKNNYYNSVFLISHQGKIVKRYDKIHLVPYGEMLPYEKHFQWLRKVLPYAGCFSQGQEFTVFKMPILDRLRIVKFNALICFEGIFGDLTRRFINQQSQFIINISNDAWSRTTAAYYQHFSMDVFRAVENKAYFLRAGNTGISAIIDPIGRITKQLKTDKQGIIVSEISLSKKKTFYTRYGDLFAQLCVIITIGLMLTRKKRENP